jgi:hypothetical protein
MDDENIVLHPARLASQAVVLQPDVGVRFIIILGDAAWCSEALWEVGIKHGASEHFRPRPSRVEALSFMIVSASVVRVPCAALVSCTMLGLHIIVPQAVPMTFLGFGPST